MSSNSKLADVFEKRENEIASKWLELQFANGRKGSPTAQAEAGRRSRDFLSALKKRNSAQWHYRHQQQRLGPCKRIFVRSFGGPS